MKIRPLHDRVVVRRKEEEATSAGGIVFLVRLKKSQIREKFLPLEMENYLKTVRFDH